MTIRRNYLLSDTIFNIRKDFLQQRSSDSDFPPKIWSQTIETNQKIIVTTVIPTRGCSWALSETGGCTVCGYVNDSSRDKPIPVKRILEEIKHTLSQIESKKPIEYKLFNSGSFFDENDVPQPLRTQIIDIIKNSQRTTLLSVESRPEYLLKNIEIVNEVKNRLKPIKLEIGVGLESSNDTIITDCWNKGSTLNIYSESVQLIRSNDIRIKSYILIKPPFLSEIESINDTLRTVKKAVEIGTDVISLNPCSIQNGTLTNFLYKKDRYQPPWLWSVLYIVKVLREQFSDLEIICEPTAGGKERGTHNCGKCDKVVLDLIDKVVHNQPIPDDLSSICSCFSRWKFLIETPIEFLRTRNLSKLRQLEPLAE